MAMTLEEKIARAKAISQGQAFPTPMDEPPAPASDPLIDKALQAQGKAPADDGSPLVDPLTYLRGESNPNGTWTLRTPQGASPIPVASQLATQPSVATADELIGQSGQSPLGVPKAAPAPADAPPPSSGPWTPPPAPSNAAPQEPSNKGPGFQPPRIPDSTELKKALAESGERQKSALGAQKIATERLQEEQQQTELIRQLDQNVEDQRNKRAAEQAQAAVTDRQTKNKAIEDDLIKMDPKRKNPYSDDGPGKGIALVIMSAIAGAAAGLQGRESNVLEIINRNIENDYQRQTDKLARKEKDLSAGGQLLRDLEGKVDKEEDRHSIYTNVIWQDAQRRLARAAQTAQNEQTKAGYIQGIGLIDQNMAMQNQPIDQQRFQSEMARAQLQLQADEARNRVNPKAGELAQKFASAEVPDLKYNGSAPPEKEQVQKVREKQAQAENVRRLLQQAVDLRKSVGTEYFDLEAVKKGKGLPQKIRMALAQYYDMTGRAMAPERLKMFNIPDDITEFSFGSGESDRTLMTLRGWQRNLQAQHDGFLKANNYSRVAQSDWDSE